MKNLVAFITLRTDKIRLESEETANVGPGGAGSVWWTNSVARHVLQHDPRPNQNPLGDAMEDQQLIGPLLEGLVRGLNQLTAGEVTRMRAFVIDVLDPEGNHVGRVLNLLPESGITPDDIKTR